ncbi:hypothetical protein [Aciditerrimonas ferrireducens]|uniref:hypothetical protein n=1 Tax=Aciditerrimonas ferrireducens TaxID=667306 RepID=UPI002002E2C7|nr:hypothetical protein [Aciditerrimonas ferrireducens]MCK4177068.1 hypothetical protein [Aciditerrimonas ferrireducens]
MSTWSERRAARRSRDHLEARPWRGPVRRYDILKEATIALVVVALLVVLLAVLFSSPDVPPVTLQAWASAQPKGFTEIALSELEGTSDSATYGPPYNHGNAEVQDLWGISVQRAFGVTDPIDPAKDFVLDPLGTVAGQPALTAALHTYEAAPKAQEMAWLQAYGRVLPRASLVGGQLVVPKADDGPVPELLSQFLAMARSGALDAALVEHAPFYTTNYTNAILFIGDSWKAQHGASYWGKIVEAQHMSGSQWGVMNETGSWPGQPWLWLYTMWYQVGPMATSSNADIEVVAIMTVCSLALLLVPFIPGIRDIPRWLPLHRVIWRDYYRRGGNPDPGSSATSTPVAQATSPVGRPTVPDAASGAEP